MEQQLGSVAIECALVHVIAKNDAARKAARDASGFVVWDAWKVKGYGWDVRM